MLLDMIDYAFRNRACRPPIWFCNLVRSLHITVPFTIEQPIGSHGFSISAGAELHLNTYTTASVKTELISGEKVTNTYKGLHQRIATVEFTGMLGWTPGVAVYVRYAPFNPFIDGYGPDYKTISGRFPDIAFRKRALSNFCPRSSHASPIRLRDEMPCRFCGGVFQRPLSRARPDTCATRSDNPKRGFDSHVCMD